MLPDLENCDEAESTENRSSKNGGNSDGSRIQSSLSKRAISTRRSLKELSEGVQQRFHPHPNLLRINEDDSPPTPIAPPRLNRNAYQKYVEPCSATTTPHSSPTVQPPRSTSVSSESRNSDWSQSVKRIDNALNRNYYTIAYSIVIIAYLAGFTEYLYFRLASILTPEHLIFHPPCEGKSSRKINKDGFHYGVSICAFIGVAIFQLLCFFALTISENWTRVKENPGDCRLAAQREEFAQFVRQMISKTMYRVFICYAVCSLINCSIIFYMVGIQDSLGDTVSTVLLYVFDAVVILYFVAFPLTTVIYHPYIQCFKPSSYPPAQIILGGSATRTQTSTLETTISAFNETTTTTTPTTKPTNFARHDPRRQNMAHRTATTTTLPVLEEYLHSPRRATATASFQPPSPVPLPIVTTMAPTPTLTHRPIGRDEEATEEEESAASQRLTTFV